MHVGNCSSIDFNMADGHEMYSSVINTLLRDNNHLTDTNSDLAKDLISSIRTINDEIMIALQINRGI